MEKKELIQHYLSEVQNKGVNLTKWESDFIESVDEQFKTRGTLSDKQVEILERIYTERV